jgi:hypothetical protein
MAVNHKLTHVVKDCEQVLNFFRVRGVKRPNQCCGSSRPALLNRLSKLLLSQKVRTRFKYFRITQVCHGGIRFEEHHFPTAIF